VRFALPGCPDILDAIAEVRWVRGRDTSDGPAGLGLQFLQMSARTKQSVRTYFAHQSSDL